MLLNFTVSLVSTVRLNLIIRSNMTLDFNLTLGFMRVRFATGFSAVLDGSFANSQSKCH